MPTSATVPIWKMCYAVRAPGAPQTTHYASFVHWMKAMETWAELDQRYTGKALLLKGTILAWSLQEILLARP